MLLFYLSGLSPTVVLKNSIIKVNSKKISPKLCLKPFSSIPASRNKLPKSILKYNVSKEEVKFALNGLSKEEVIERVLQVGGDKLIDALSASFSKELKKEKIDEPIRTFDMTKYAQRTVALKVAYLGWNYAGLEAQGKFSTAIPVEQFHPRFGLKLKDPMHPKKVLVATVEDYLLEALENCKLISSKHEVKPTLCGRTDKGVNGLSQVIGVMLRSGLDKQELAADPMKVDGELPYVDMINRSLPEDIRAISWAPVPSDFSARFDCKSRQYKYLFTTQGVKLDIAAMRKASEYLIGSHDFRNFCRQVGRKQATEFTRNIFEITIQPATISLLTPDNNLGGELMEFVIKGSGFLWHQVRCIMGVLFRIGQGQESPSLVLKLLDIELSQRKPNYIMASPFALFLHDCEYNPPLQWQNHSEYSKKALVRIYKKYYTIWYESILKAYHYSNILNQIDKDLGPGGFSQAMAQVATPIALVNGAGHDSYVYKYTPFSERECSEPVEILNKKFRERMLKSDILKK